MGAGVQLDAPAPNRGELEDVGETMAFQRLSIIRWQQTQGKYVGILQDVQRFKADTLKPKLVGNMATVLVGELTGSYQREWYCITFPKEEMEFEEARTRAGTILEMENQRRAQGKPSLAGN